MPFVPDHFAPPTALAIGDLRLEPLGPEHNERDYAAWTSSTAHILRSPGFPYGKWPYEMSLEANLADLVMHAGHFVDRVGFTFTVLDPDDDVVGCLYVYPAKEEGYDAKARSWVRTSIAHRDDEVRRAIAAWLTSDAWPFARPLYDPLLT